MRTVWDLCRIGPFLAHSAATWAPVVAKRSWQGCTARRESRTEVPLWVPARTFLSLKQLGNSSLQSLLQQKLLVYLLLNKVSFTATT